MKEFRERIANVEKEQKIIKPQRKTVHFTGERTIGPSEATYKVNKNRDDLRLMYAAYNLLRGKGFDVTEKNAKPLNARDYYERNGYYIDKELEGKHPLFNHIGTINCYLEDYGFKIPSHEEEYKNWLGNKQTKKVFDYENYEKIIYFGE